MPQPFADAMNWVPKSRALAATLSRAHDFARAHGHLAVGLEHLLLSLIEDQDAANVLEASGVALENLSADVAAHLAILPVDEGVVPEADEALLRILEYAVAAAQQSRRRDVNGGIVLAAIVGEGKSEAANLLRNHGMTFAAAIEAIKGGPRTVTGPPGGVPAPARPAGSSPSGDMTAVHDAASDTTEEILARARRRVEALQAPAPAPARIDEPKGEPPLAELSLAKGPLAKEPLDEAERAAATAPPAIPSSPPPIPPAPPPPAPPSWLPPGPPAAAPATHAARVPPPMPPLFEPPASDRRLLRADPTSSPPPPPGRATAGPAAAGIAPWNDAPLRADVPHPVPPRAPPGIGVLDAGRDEQAAAQPRRRRRRGQQRQDTQPEAALDHTFDDERFAAALPRRAKVGRPFTVEIGLDRAEVAAFAAFGEPSATSLTLRLGLGSGAAHIETGPPETIWLDTATGVYSEDSVVWRWTVTPKRAGRLKLRFTGSLRSQDGDGRPLDNPVPDHTVELRVRRSYAGLIRQLVLMSLAAGAAAALDDMAEPLLQQFIQVIRTYAGK